MGSLLALGSAVLYGIADYTGGLLARRMNYALVAVVGQVGGLVATAIAAVAVTPRMVGAADLGWGALSGVGTGIGMAFLYRGLSRTPMSVTVPVTAVGGIALPVLVGVAFLGERPSLAAWAGVAVGVPALWFVSQTSRESARRVDRIPVDALIAGAGIAVQYLTLAQPAEAAGLWPLAAGRLTAALTVLPLVRTARYVPRPPARLLVAAALVGTVAAGALVLYTLATREQLLAIAVVLSSLYPVIPVALGIVVLGERLTRVQALGLVATAASVALITTG